MRFNGREANGEYAVRGRAVALGLGIVAAAILLLWAACSSGDDDGDDGQGRGSTTTEATSPTTQPEAAGESVEEALVLVESVVLESTELTDSLFQDPSRIEFPDDPDLERLRDFYTPGSSVPDGVVGQLQDLAESDQHLQPSSVSGVFREMRVYQLEPAGPDTVRFNFCANQDRETVDQAGKVISQYAEVTQGTGEARRVDGVWRIQQMDRNADTTLPVQPGKAVSGTCDTLYPRGGET